MGDRPSTPPPEAKQPKLVVVRGRVQTKASVESEDSKRDAEALVALNVSEKAVFIERTQTVRINSELWYFFLVILVMKLVLPAEALGALTANQHDPRRFGCLVMRAVNSWL